MTEPLDMSQDPDRFVPDPGPAGPVDPAHDPDRYDPAKDSVRPGRGQTLPELLGEGAQEDERNNLTWLLGLLGIVAFLVLVSVLVNLH
jgi:hypothetical protein